MVTTLTNLAPPLEPGTPDWFKRYYLRLTGPQRGPVQLAPYLSTELPAVVRGGLIDLTDLGQPGYSDGISWYPITLGGAL